MRNIILSDCKSEVIADFKRGCELNGVQFEILSSISNNGHGSFWKKLKRYLTYFTFPFVVFLHRKEYSVILGWQQFYAINYAFFCRLFHVKKANVVCAVNFTYKKKSGILGTIYKAYMKYACGSKYIDYIHLPSKEATMQSCKELGLPEEKFIIACFGVADIKGEYQNSRVPMSDYCLSLGRSNRDFDFLVETWRDSSLQSEKLVIIADSWNPKSVLPQNVIHYNDIQGDDAIKWIRNCKLMIIPIADGKICSGDTILLRSMIFEKPVVITEPSTLSEMYIRNGYNGVCVKKNVGEAAKQISSLLSNIDEMKCVGQRARQSYIENYSQEILGRNIINGIS